MSTHGTSGRQISHPLRAKLETLKDHMSAPKTTIEHAFEDSRTSHTAPNTRESSTSTGRGRDDESSSTSVVVAGGSTDRGSGDEGLL